MTWQSGGMGVSNDLIVVGYAKVPTTSASHGAGELFVIVLRVDPDHHTVVGADSTAITQLVQSWIQDLVVGADLRKTVAPLLEKIDQQYFGTAAGSIKQALSDAWRRYTNQRLNGQSPSGEA